MNSSPSTVQTTTFLADVLSCSLSAYGGPEAHIALFNEYLVDKRGYLSEEELMELLALCSILPGPTSTQTIVALGYKLGGPLLGILTMLVWAAPIILIMSVLSCAYVYVQDWQITKGMISYIGPMAVGFIVVASWRIGRKVVIDRLTGVVMLMGALATYCMRDPWVFPLVLSVGGAITIAAARKEELWQWPSLRPPWGYGIACVLCALGSVVVASLTDVRLIHLFEQFYRYGYLVFGGGQVVVPLMHTELVELRGYLSSTEFLTGYGLVQGLPGPLFSFAAFAGGMAAREASFMVQFGSGILSGVAIFLPGLLLIYFIYPLWEQLKQVRAIACSLKGIKAVAGGMMLSAALILIEIHGFTLSNAVVVLASAAALLSKKVPAPLLVVAVLVLGALSSGF